MIRGGGEKKRITLYTLNRYFVFATGRGDAGESTIDIFVTIKFHDILWRATVAKYY